MIRLLGDLNSCNAGRVLEAAFQAPRRWACFGWAGRDAPFRVANVVEAVACGVGSPAVAPPLPVTVWRRRRVSRPARQDHGGNLVTIEVLGVGEPPPPDRCLLDYRQLSIWLNDSVRHLRRLVDEDRIPYIKVGHFVRFDPTAIAEWLAASQRGAPL